MDLDGPATRRVVLSALLLVVFSCGDPLSNLIPPPAKKPAPRPRSERVQPLEVGGDVKPPIVRQRVEPDLSRCVGPYSGVSIVEIHVRADGGVQYARVFRKINPCIDDAVVAAVMQWEFRPATLHGRPVDVFFNATVRVDFK